MAFKQVTRQNLDANSSSVNGLHRAALYRVNDNGEIRKVNEGRFLLNPSSWEEAKTSNWNPTQVPGQSDPVLQWSSSGPRTVTFDTLVTNETSYFTEANLTSAAPAANTIAAAVKSFVGGIASRFAKVPGEFSGFALSKTGDNKLGIDKYLNYYRSLLYPKYNIDTNPTKLISSPPLVVLMVGKTFTNSVYSNKIDMQSTVWVVTNLRIKITKQLPNLTPMEAIVSFEMMQYNIRSTCQNLFYPNH